MEQATAVSKQFLSHSTCVSTFPPSALIRLSDPYRWICTWDKSCASNTKEESGQCPASIILAGALPQQNRYPTRLVASNKMLPKIGEAIAWEEASARWQNRNCWRRSETVTGASSKKDKGRILDEFIAITGHCQVRRLNKLEKRHRWVPVSAGHL